MSEIIDLSLSVCNSSDCSSITVSDTTGLYNATSNVLGYGGGNSEAIDATAATIEITYQDGSTSTTDVLSQMPDPQTEDSFSFNAITLPSSLDGEYSVKYTLTFAEYEVTDTVCLILTCNARCCIDKMWAKAALEASYDCGCDSYMKKAMQAEGMLTSLKNSAIFNNEVARNKMLATIQRLCKMENCNCK